ncbi:C-type lectin domain family 4 member D isoform X4 [Struthio camelus]|uniref:C-type lectin domain family 4 member D isoform X4 n=1 Tax=Struthio camelus TaxID=8801 RepID=UPI003603AE44
MASDIVYAEVKFKNESLSAEVKAPPEKKEHEPHTQKYPPWLPWLISLLLLLVCITLVITLLVTNFSHSHEEPKALQQNATELLCISAMPQSKGQSWMCCPVGWRLFQKGCYYKSTDSMSWNNSKQNCTGMGSHLVVIDTEAEQVFLSAWLKEKSEYERKDNYYIGLSAQKVGQWHWVDQTPFNVTAVFWRTGEPSNVEKEKCVVIHWKEKEHWNWNDLPSMTSRRLCSRMLQSGTVSPTHLQRKAGHAAQWIGDSFKKATTACQLIRCPALHCTGMGSHLVVTDTEAEQPF